MLKLRNHSKCCSNLELETFWPCIIIFIISEHTTDSGRDTQGLVTKNHNKVKQSVILKHLTAGLGASAGLFHITCYIQFSLIKEHIMKVSSKICVTIKVFASPELCITLAAPDWRQWKFFQ